MSAVQFAERSSAAAPPHAAWITDVPEGSVYGSLYAAPAPDREAVADRFAAIGLPIHLDVILDREDTGELVHRGIVAAELRDLGARHPDSLLEVHLIVLAGARGRAVDGYDPELRDEIAAVLEAAASVGAQRAAVPAGVAADASLTEAFRAAGGEVWTVLEPGDDPASLDAGTAGALIMLIEPGTREPARPELLERIPQLAPAVQVSVDGGVDAAIALRAIELGAHHVIVGRALLGRAHTQAVRGEQS